MRTVERPMLFESAYRSPPLTLRELSDADWRKALPVGPAVRRRRPQPEPATQVALFA